MSHYKPYPAYKESGVEWLGRVPKHWQALPCRSVVDEKNQKNDDARIQEYLSLMANVGVIPYEEKGDVGNKKPEDLSKCKVVSRGNLVINSMNYGIGSFGLSSYNGVCSPVYIVLQPKRNVVEDRFALRVFENKEFQRHAQSFGTGILEHRAAIGWDDLKGIHVGIPPLAEQATILSVLDRETARIDALIEKKTRFIELLREKRQALITHAVTKGLNPNAKMKDSGVEWLGEVPEHWTVSSLKYFWSVQDCKHLTAEFTDEGYPLASIREVQGKYVTLEEAKVTSRHFYELLIEGQRQPEAGDLIFSRNATVGQVAQVAEWHPPFAMGQDVCLLRKKDGRQSTDFMQLLLRSSVVVEQLEQVMLGATFKRVNVEDIRNLLVPMPSPDEQALIVATLQIKLERIDSLSTNTEKSIRLLQERRSALITAAVTGQIDLREAS